jgi:UDPglucose 6-dehydrogenase
MKKITVVGSGYVGSTIAVMLSQFHKVTILDVNENRVNQINNRKSPIRDEVITRFLTEKELLLSATLNDELAYLNADFIVVATPTDYNPSTGYFDTSTVGSVIKSALAVNDKALIVIKSTIPIGYTEALRKELGTNRIVFSPEFLREGSALHDNLYPSRIIVGDSTEHAKAFGFIMADCADAVNPEVIFMSSSEAEAVKLFSNAYLAMRVSFFNELDSFCMNKGLSTRNVIEGVCLDTRIGAGYNNPSFGYGGYCLPKDTKQLLANYSTVLNRDLISAIVSSNASRREFIVGDILKGGPKIVGAYRLIMKEGSDNFRESSIQAVMNSLSDQGVQIVIYEPEADKEEMFGFNVIKDWADFCRMSDVIIANRSDALLSEVSTKVFTRDIFNNN